MDKVTKLLYKAKNETMANRYFFAQGEIVEVMEISLIPGKEGSFQFMNKEGDYLRLKANEFLNKFTLDSAI